MTHDERDQQAARNGEAFTIAEHEGYRCQCKYGNPCKRRATLEDLLCDWCRGRNHDQACYDLVGGTPMYAPLESSPTREDSVRRAVRDFDQAVKAWPRIP